MDLEKQRRFIDTLIDERTKDIAFFKEHGEYSNSLHVRKTMQRYITESEFGKRCQTCAYRENNGACSMASSCPADGYSDWCQDLDMSRYDSGVTVTGIKAV